MPDAGVMGLIGAPALEQAPARLQRAPLSGIDTVSGLVGTGATGLAHSTLDDCWRQRGFRGDVNHLPILMIDGFFDVESRGAFQAYQALRGDGAQLEVIGAHDGAPKGTDGGVKDSRRGSTTTWRAPRSRDQPRVQLWMSDGDREDDLAGDFVRYDAGDWPVPGTTWRSLALGAGGTLTSARPKRCYDRVVRAAALADHQQRPATTRRSPAAPGSTP